MDLRVSKLFIQLAFWAVLCDAFIMLALIVAAILNYAGPENAYFLNFLPLIDFFVLLVLALFLKRNNRIAAVILVLYQFIFNILTLGQSNDYIQILWFVFFVLGLLGVFRYKKLMTEEYND
jgi:hypothetical protein